MKTNNLVKAGFFLSLGLVFPSLFHMAGLAGPIFLPMHIPVLLCGFFLGERYGLLTGAITPLVSSFLTGMPPLFPTGIAMALELATYGFTAGYLYMHKKQNVFISLIIGMLLGRIVSGIANYILLFGSDNTFVFGAFLTATFFRPIWGIIIQLIAIPSTVKIFEKNKGWVRNE